MIKDEDIYDFLEHRGVKGMHWGVRKGRTSKSGLITTKQKIGIAALGGGVGILGARFMASRGLNIPISLAFGGASAYAGATAARALVDKFGDQKI